MRLQALQNRIGMLGAPWPIRRREPGGRGAPRRCDLADTCPVAARFLAERKGQFDPMAIGQDDDAWVIAIADDACLAHGPSKIGTADMTSFSQWAAVRRPALQRNQIVGEAARYSLQLNNARPGHQKDEDGYAGRHEPVPAPRPRPPAGAQWHSRRTSNSQTQRRTSRKVSIPASCRGGGRHLGQGADSGQRQ